MKRPAGKNIVKNRWLFKIKRDANGSVVCYRAKGLTQRFGVDYLETFSPVLRYNSLRISLSLAVERNLDIKTAFLNSRKVSLN